MGASDMTRKKNIVSKDICLHLGTSHLTVFLYVMYVAVSYLDPFTHPHPRTINQIAQTAQARILVSERCLVPANRFFPLES